MTQFTNLHIEKNLQYISNKKNGSHPQMMKEINIA